MDRPPARDSVLTEYAKSLIRFKARQLSRKPGFSRSDEEDVAQELTMQLLARAHLFDPARASASTFADRVVRSAIAMMLRDRGRLKRAAGFRTQSIDQADLYATDPSAALRDRLKPSDLFRRTGASDQGRSAEMAITVVEAFQSLPPDLQDLCRKLIDGTESSAARELGVSRRQVRNAVAEIRRRFTAAGLENF